MHPHPTSWRAILILSSHLRLGLSSVLVPLGFPIQTLHTHLLSAISATCLAYLILLYFITELFGWALQIIKLVNMLFSQLYVAQIIKKVLLSREREIFFYVSLTEHPDTSVPSQPGQQTGNWKAHHVKIVAYVQYTSWWLATNMTETCRGWLTK